MSDRLPFVGLDAGWYEAPSKQLILAILQPASGSVDWPNDQEILIQVADVSNDVALGWPADVTKVWINDQLAFDRSAAPPYFQAGWNGPNSTFTPKASFGSFLFADIHEINIDPENLFSSEEVVRVRVYAESIGGYALDETYTFTIRDTTKPQVTSVVAISPNQVEVTFNEPMQMHLGSGGALRPQYYVLSGITPPYYLPNILMVEEAANYKVIIDYDQELSHGQTYQLAVQEVKDVNGNDVVISINTFTACDLIAPDRSFNLWSKIPLLLRRRDTALTGGSAGHTERLLACLQDVTDLLWQDVDLLAHMYDIDLAPMDAINLLLEQFGNPFQLDLSDLQKRKLLRNLVYMYRQKGTEVGIINTIFFFMGIPVTITKPLARGWRLGYHKLGIETILGPSDSASRFTFWVNCPVYLTDAERKQMNDIINIMKAAHEHHVIIEPTPPPPATWRLGYDKLGIGSRLGA